MMKNITEEKRLQEIDEIACLFDAETVEAAKYGPHACTAQEMTYRAAVKAAQSGIDPKAVEARAVVKALLHGQD